MLWAGWPFHRAAWRSLRHGGASMDTLISLGTLAAWGWSLIALLFLGAGDDGMHMRLRLVAERGAPRDSLYLEVASVVVTLILAGRFLEARAKQRAGSALRSLLELGAKDVAVLADDGRERRVPVEQLRVGDRFVVRPGERVAADGVVEQGSSAVDQSLLTGESLPVEKAPGDELAGGTVNAGGRLVVRATRVGSETALARIARLVQEAQAGQAPVQRLADRVSAVFVPIVLVLALVTLGAWLLSGASAAFAFTAAVALLIVACPCALGLATPTALLVGTGRGAQLGLLIRGPEVLESTRRIDTILLDKTGTVTTGRMQLREVRTVPGVERAELLRLAGALEHASEHPIARAIALAAQRELGALPPVDGFASRDGLGVEGHVEGRAVVVGRPAFLAERGVSDGSRPADGDADADGATVVAVGWDGELRGALLVGDAVKPTSAQAVAELRALGLRPVLLTGDGAASARRVAAEVGIDAWSPGVLPEGKAEGAELQARAEWSRWSATASTTRPRSRRPTSGWRSARAPTLRSRRPT